MKKQKEFGFRYQMEIKTLKLNLVLMPLCFCGMLWMYPPVSQSEEKKMQERYERSAGWKT